MDNQECCKEEAQCADTQEREWTQEEAQAVVENKLFRQQLDIILQNIKGGVRVSRERSLLITKMQEAIMWAGMDLKALNDGRTIYPDSYDPSNTKVAPTADGLKL